MTTVLAPVALLLAAGLHLYVFVHESILFSRPATQSMFQVEPQHAPAIRLWAYHQSGPTIKGSTTPFSQAPPSWDRLRFLLATARRAGLLLRQPQ